MLLRGALYYFFIVTVLVVPLSSAESRKATCFGSAPATDGNNLVRSITMLLKDFAELERSASFHEADGKKYFVDVLRYEFFTMSAGKRFIISPPTDSKLERRQQETAFAVAGVWMGLYNAEKVDSVLNKVFEEAVTQHWSKREPLTMGLMQATLKSVINLLGNAIEDDPELSIFYAYAQSEYRLGHYQTSATRPKVHFSFDDIITRGRVNEWMVDAWLEDLSVRYCIIHRQFLGLRKADKDHRVWVRSILKLGRELLYHSKMQQIYTNAVNETGLHFVAEDFPNGTMRVLAGKINTAVEADDELKKRMDEVVEEDSRYGGRVYMRGCEDSSPPPPFMFSQGLIIDLPGPRFFLNSM